MPARILVFPYDDSLVRRFVLAEAIHFVPKECVVMMEVIRLPPEATFRDLVGSLLPLTGHRWL